MTQSPPLSGAADAAPVVSWILSDAAGRLDLPDLVDGFCRKLGRRGLRLFRVAFGARVNHPQVFARAVLWTPEEGSRRVVREHGIQFTATYRDSPVAHLHRGEGPIRRRLAGPPEAQEFEVLGELRGLGATDYLALPVHLDGAPGGFVSFTTLAPEGFAEREIELLKAATPVLGLRLEIHATRDAMRDLLQIYLGEEAARRVLAGEVRPGTGQPMEAVIWISDMRGFTALADRLSAGAVIEALDGYFECTAGAVRRHGGEVLKFIGDGVLGVFPLDAAPKALAAAREAFMRLEALNRERREAALPALRTGIALNVGQVIYGNVGALDRLDFTVIGRAVNETARIESLTKRLGRPLLASARFAALCRDGALVPAGFHALPGVREPMELYALEEREVPASQLT